MSNRNASRVDDGSHLVLTDAERTALDHAYDLFADTGSDIVDWRDNFRPTLANFDDALFRLRAARAMLAALESSELPLPLDHDLAAALWSFARDCAWDLKDHRGALVEVRAGRNPYVDPDWPEETQALCCTMQEASENVRASIDRDLEDLKGSRSILSRAGTEA
jgi:hypothetical protein